MLHIKFLRNLLILALMIAVLFPGYQYLFVHPAYKQLLTEETENESVRYASYMVRTLGLENQTLTRELLPEGLRQKLQPVSRDRRLVKLRIFSPRGEIIFSTLEEEVGGLNKNSYFHEVVAKGEVYSKVVRKDQATAEGAVTHIDIVETYVPFMAGAEFGGAMEVYYDITSSVSRVRQLSLHAMVITLLMSLGFLLAIYAALCRAHTSLLQRDQAEEALRLVNEELEQRVEERTSELSIANEQLTSQIVERAEAQMALAKALDEIKVDREKLDGILSSVPDGVLVADGSLNVLHMNAAAESILGATLDQVLGQSLGAFGQELGLLKKIGQRLNVAQGSRSFEFEAPTKDAKVLRSYQVRISQLVAEQGKSAGIVLLIRDVTREREVERMKSAFLGMAAHELNTPLTTIIGYSELLTSKETENSFDDKQKRDYIQLIHDKALALGGLVDDLLDVTRIESGRPLALNYQEFDFPAMIGEVLDGYLGQGDRHQFAVALPEETAQLCADRERLQQVIDHLVSNAVKYSPGGGEVSVSLTLSDRTYELSVEDQGIGMNEEELSHIFDRFYRADSSDTAVQGVGLGMSIVRHIVQAHHGDIKVESQPGVGTRVRVVIPVAPPAVENERTPFFSS